MSGAQRALDTKKNKIKAMTEALRIGWASPFKTLGISVMNYLPS